MDKKISDAIVASKGRISKTIVKHGKYQRSFIIQGKSNRYNAAKLLGKLLEGIPLKEAEQQLLGIHAIEESGTTVSVHDTEFE